MEEMRIELNEKNLDNLEVYSRVLNKTPNTIFNEALHMYFEKADEIIAAQSLEGDGTHTNLDYDEFWDGVDI